MLTQSQKHLIDKLSKADATVEEIKRLFGETQNNLKEIEDIDRAIKQEHKDFDSAIKKLIEEKTQGFPWLADAISQYHELRDLKIAEFLEQKLRPGLTSAQRVKEIAREKREFQKKFIITRNLIRYYEALFPWLSDFVGEDIDELLVQATQPIRAEDEENDPVSFYLTAGEYETLSTAERNQRALDRYWSRRKDPWQIGRDYERYIGYLYEQKGFAVYYQGIERGFEDLGRDLICKKGNLTEIIQCKRWREDKTIHEKHITQLFGTTVEYFIRDMQQKQIVQLNMFPDLLKKGNLTASIVTSATLSEEAKKFAAVLGVKFIEKFPFQQYPCIKCNVSHRDGTKIYHLPFDQQYDRTLIDEERNERFVETVEEAERRGFRRAWRWRGNTES